ncbi:H-NS histone family protein [Desulforhopalus singaporensis]|uniref:DNA-binding protein n=1 Tax=Desulforhopalus singaporensis TaxID=91360 RepID=A0A1H0LZQ2_9BACT|nr:H-NS family nucleoid-associated regulatory protein [Desulforhopalus singaporensis]SDO73702.1 DNA-binding protein H-NS [Desulforhopalus singaporensis]
MSEFIRIITHARRFKSAVKDLGIEQLEEIKNKLDKIMEDRLEEEAEEEKKNAERIAKINKYKEMLEADGIGLSELQEAEAGNIRKRTPRKPKYEIWNESGERITWTGQGRMPNIFKARLEEGESMDTFLIED